MKPGWRRSPRRLVVAGIAVLVIASSASACSDRQSGAPGGSQTSSPVTDWRTSTDGNVSAQQASDCVVPLAQADPAIGYFNVAITPAGLEVAQTQAPSKQLLASYQSAAGAVPVHVRVVAHSGTELQAVSDRIRAAVVDGKLDGVQVTDWGADYASDLMVIHLVTYSATVAKDLESKFGPLVSVSTKPGMVSTG
jgi:hypothetical protein